jgi:hypothetical protein
MKQRNEELILLRLNDAPSWFAVDKDGRQSLFDSRNLQNHFQIFLGAV